MGEERHLVVELEPFALANPLAASPTVLATAPSPSPAARSCFQTSFESTAAWGPDFHTMLSACRPCFAAHM